MLLRGIVFHYPLVHHLFWKYVPGEPQNHSQLGLIVYDVHLTFGTGFANFHSNPNVSDYS